VVSIPGSCRRDTCVTLNFAGRTIELERIGTDGDAALAKSLFTELDGQVDCLSVGGVGGVGLDLPLGTREFRLLATLKLVDNKT